MRKSILPGLAVAMALGLNAWSADLPAVPAQTTLLPDSIRATLDQEYPGWKLAPVSPQVLKEFKKHKVTRSPSIAIGDFDHDGKIDYAVQIALTVPGQEEQIIIIFLERENAYEETIVQSMGLDPTVYLWVINKGVLMVLGGPIGETLYGYEDGKFQEIVSQEDPEHPDPSIPRPEEAH